MNDLEERLRGTVGDGCNTQSAFSRRIQELQGVSETASLLAKSLGDIEKQLLGPRMEPTSGIDTPEYRGGSLNDDLEKYTNRTILSLSEISDSIQRLGSELGGVSEDVPSEDYPTVIGAEYRDRDRR